MYVSKKKEYANDFPILLLDKKWSKKLKYDYYKGGKKQWFM